MLMKLLNIIADKGLYSYKSIAKELNITEGMLEGLIEQLLRMGYIEKVKISDCSGGCSCCSGKSSCGGDKNNSNVGFWKITEKGSTKITR